MSRSSDLESRSPSRVVVALAALALRVDRRRRGAGSAGGGPPARRAPNTGSDSEVGPGPQTCTVTGFNGPRPSEGLRGSPESSIGRARPAGLGISLRPDSDSDDPSPTPVAVTVPSHGRAETLGRCTLYDSPAAQRRTAGDSAARAESVGPATAAPCQWSGSPEPPAAARLAWSESALHGRTHGTPVTQIAQAPELSAAASLKLCP